MSYAENDLPNPEVETEPQKTTTHPFPEGERLGLSYPNQVHQRLHGSVYQSLGGLFFGIIIVFMLTFLGSPITLFNLAICFIYLVMYLGGPLIMMRLHDETLQDGTSLRRFVKEKFSTNTGQITGAQAWFQICLIPAALFITAAGMGLIITFTS